MRLQFAAALLAAVAFALSAHAQKTGSGRELAPARCDEIRSAQKELVGSEKFRGKVSIRFLAQLNAYLASNCTRPINFEFDATKEDRAYWDELLSRL